MTDALEEQLCAAAATPSHDLDVQALIARDRRRRRRLVGGVAAAVVVVLATVGIATIATGGSGDDAQIAIGARDDASTPDGWTRVQLDRSTSIAVPEGWGPVSFASRYVPMLGVVGTDSPAVDGGDAMGACRQPENASARKGTWVFVYEVEQTWLVNDRIFANLPGESGGGPVSERPTNFGPEYGSLGGACSTPPVPEGDSTRDAFYAANDSTFQWYLFSDHGRTFAAQVVVNDHGQTVTTELGDRVLDTFRVDDPTVGTTTTLPAVTTAPATTTPPPADASPDELAIRDVYMHLIGQVPRDAIGDYVEDYDSIADSWRAGIAQNSEATQAQYSMRVDSVTMTDATHADVRYSLLFSGRPAYPDEAGGAVKIDGRWYITRETVCSLLTNGGITCPVRTTPIP